MGKTYDEIDERLAAFIRAQHMFFVATAPLARDGHVNVSPKGLDALCILDPLRVAYLDRGGSGIETVAHVRENARIVLMFCAFEGPPKIVRLHGRARAVEPGDEEWVSLAAPFGDVPEPRNVIVVEIDRIADSCGYGVPLLAYQGDRDQLNQWVDRKGSEAIARYRQEHNASSIDGLPGLRRLSWGHEA